MSATNRSKLISKLFAALKKHYSVPPASPSRPLLEHALYACLLEDCPSELADEGLAKLEQDYFDWNEVRVTTVTELSGVLSNLPDPNKAATRLKANLQAIFEEFYSFDLDHLKKENLGKAVAKFEKLPSMTPFVLSYIIQHGLGGHSIPIDYSAMVIMLVSGIASQNEASDGRVPGLERAIPKSKGIDFANLLHQPAVALLVDTEDKTARALLESVAKGSSAGLDEWLVSKKAAKKRVAQRKAEERETAKQEAEAEAAAVAENFAATPAGKKKPIRSAAKATSTTNKPKPKKKATATENVKPEPPKKEPAAAEAETETPASTAPKKPTASATPTKKTSEPAAAPKKTAKKIDPQSSAAAAKPTSKKKSVAAKTPSPEPTTKTSSGKKATNRKLTKRKPR
jgi:endonuclease-3